MLSPVDYQEFKYINQIIEALADHAPVIVFGKGCWFALNEMGKSRASALGGGLAHQETRYCPVEISLYKVILTHQDCCHLFR
jgi:uroporphyrinogen-III decarboxylase